ncbi:Rha family transcriptional regulator [Acinetobacter sp. YH12231]|uniref:Rha family transcriptional regulator n=1 Tax=Acinetobacter sp. YH12231 TaxID=2601160 RepID=UPI0015D167FF|nr:Rha family transcriptional regulator [Acinetobacter sp. YH12231]
MTNIMTTDEIVIVEGDKALTTSLHIADGSKANHKAVMQLIKTHIHHFNKFGRVAFQMRPFETDGGVQTRRIALLNEQQATFLMTLMRNTERVVDFKCALVQAFFRTKEYLSNQHQAHTTIHNKLNLQLGLEKADASLAGHILGSYRKKRDTLISAIKEVEKLMQPCLPLFDD